MDVPVSAFTCWRIVRTGSFGIVLKADWTNNGKANGSVIIKAPNPHAVRSASINRLLTEAAVQATCDHECIVRCLGTVQIPVSLLEQLAGISPQQPADHDPQQQALSPQQAVDSAVTGTAGRSTAAPAPLVLSAGAGGEGLPPTQAAVAAPPQADAAAASAEGEGGTSGPSPAPPAIVLGLIQEYMEAGSLYDMLLLQQHPGLAQVGAYTPRQALTWLLQLARALAYLHSATPRIIHRDIKPENVLLSQVSSAAGQLNAKLTDFGLCAMLHPTQDSKLCVRRMLSSRCSSPDGAADPPATASTSSSGAAAAATPAAQLQEQQPDVSKLATDMCSTGTDQVVGGVSEEVLGVTDDLHQQQDSAVQAPGVDKQLAKDMSAHTADPGSTQQQLQVEAGEVDSVGMRLTGGCGSILYMAPEVYGHRPYNQAADVFSWAMLAWELLSGQLLSGWVTEHTTEGCRAFRAAVAGGWRPPWPQDLAGGSPGAACEGGEGDPGAAEKDEAGLGAAGSACSAGGMPAAAGAASGGGLNSSSSSSSSRDSVGNQDAATAAATHSHSVGAAEASLLADAIQKGLHLISSPAAAGGATSTAPAATAAAGGGGAGARAERVRQQLLRQVVQLVERCWCGAPEGRPGMGEVAAVLQQALTVLQMAENAAAAAAGGPSGAASVSSYRSSYSRSTSGLQTGSVLHAGRTTAGTPPYSRSNTQQLGTAPSLLAGRTSTSLGGLAGPQACPEQGRGRSCCLQ